MSRLIARAGVVLVALSFFVIAPAAEARSVRAIVTFASSVAPTDRATAISAAGGQVLRVRGDNVLVRIGAAAADQLRTAMGVVSVRVRGR